LGEHTTGILPSSGQFGGTQDGHLALPAGSLTRGYSKEDSKILGEFRTSHTERFRLTDSSPSCAQPWLSSTSQSCTRTSSSTSSVLKEWRLSRPPRPFSLSFTYSSEASLPCLRLSPFRSRSLNCIAKDQVAARPTRNEPMCSHSPSTINSKSQSQNSVSRFPKRSLPQRQLRIQRIKVQTSDSSNLQLSPFLRSDLARSVSICISQFQLWRFNSDIDSYMSDTLQSQLVQTVSPIGSMCRQLTKRVNLGGASIDSSKFLLEFLEMSSEFD